MLVGGRSGPSRVGMVMRGGWHKWSIMLISYNSKSDPEQRHITSRLLRDDHSQWDAAARIYGL